MINSRKKEVTPIYTKKIRYVAVHKIVEREEPYAVYEAQSYFCHQTDAFRQRMVPRKLDSPATHEIHLAGDTITASMDALAEYQRAVAVHTSLCGSVRPLLDLHHGVGVYVYGEPGQEEDVYFILTWKNVLNNPNPDQGLTTGGSPKRVQKIKYPDGTLSRVEDRRKVYYLRKADAAQRSLVLEALTRDKPV